MDYEIRQYGLLPSPNCGLGVVQCGVTRCLGPHARGPMLQDNCSMTFVRKGRGVYTAGEKSHALGSGEGFVILPGMVNTYRADDDDPWEYTYVIFSGREETALLRSAGLGPERLTFSYPQTEDFVGLLDKMFSLAAEGREYGVTGCFLMVMDCLSRENAPREKRPPVPEEYVRKAVSYMENNFTYPITVADIAAHVGVDRSYLYRFFRKGMGCAPSEYLIAIRLRKAEALMHHGELSLSEIAAAVGFYDVSHFSKAFTVHYGMPPGRWRGEQAKKERI